MRVSKGKTMEEMRAAFSAQGQYGDGIFSVKLLQMQQRFGQHDPAASELHCGIVATVFAFRPHHRGHPPHGRMKVEKRFDEGLDQIEQPVAPGNMRQLMRQNGFHFGWREMIEQTQGEKNDRLEISQRHR